MYKPKCKLVGENGNIFSLVGKVSRTLRENNLKDKIGEMQNRVTASKSYDEALSILSDYVEIC